MAKLWGRLAAWLFLAGAAGALAAHLAFSYMMRNVIGAAEISRIFSSLGFMLGTVIGALCVMGKTRDYTIQGTAVVLMGVSFMLSIMVGFSGLWTESYAIGIIVGLWIIHAGIGFMSKE